MAKLCLSLTGSTIRKDLEVLDRYRNVVDLAELRVDFLEAQEQFYVRGFPEKAGMPTILTVRRKADGGRFDQGEGVRLVIFAKGLAYADTDPTRNFAYVDIEHDFDIPAIQEAARTFGTKVIRSLHRLDGMPPDMERLWKGLSSNPYEIPKVSVKARGVADVEALMRFFAGRQGAGERIVNSPGEYGFCTRVLTDLTGSMLTYASATGAGLEPSAPGQLDPEILIKTYRCRVAGPGWDLYGLLGGPSVVGSLSPALHNAGFAKAGIRALYLPFPADELEPFMRLAELLGLKGFSVTVPFKERVLQRLSERSVAVDAIGACNTAARTPAGWSGHNTDAYGFKKSVLEFLGAPDLRGVRACLVGAGGAARAAAYTLHELGATACVINRSITKAKRLAERYGFAWSGMTERAVDLMERHNDLIVQATSVGMDGGPPGDPIDWYEFTGREAVFEAIYNPPETPLLKRARAAGCRAVNGLGMLKAQAAAQFKLFTGLDYPG